MADTKRVRRHLGYMPDHFSMYPQMTVFEYLDFFAAAYGQRIEQRNRTIEDVLTLTDMGGRRDDLIKGLSRGMQQRVSLARVLVHDPDLLLLDEPASGLDPRARIEMMEIHRELARMGKTVLISSHILSELATLCDAVTIIDRGKTQYSGPMHDLLERRVDGSETFELRVDEAVDGFEEHIQTLEGVTDVVVPEGKSLYIITFDPQKTDAARVLRGALDRGVVRLAGYNRVRKHLDQAFMDLTTPGVRS